MESHSRGPRKRETRPGRYVVGGLMTIRPIMMAMMIVERVIVMALTLLSVTNEWNSIGDDLHEWHWSVLLGDKLWNNAHSPPIIYCPGKMICAIFARFKSLASFRRPETGTYIKNLRRFTCRNVYNKKKASNTFEAFRIHFQQ